MSASIPETKLVSELLKPTGFNCPENLEGKTFEEATEGGGDVELEDNKSAAINVTAYTTPVVVNPTEGKDAMKKVTVTLTNIPSPSVNSYAFYCWQENAHTVYFTLSENPQIGDNAYSADDSGSPDRYTPPVKIVSVSDTVIVAGESTLFRNESGDITYMKS